MTTICITWGSYAVSHTNSPTPIENPLHMGNFLNWGFISSYRPEHRHSHSTGGQSCGKNHPESIWRAMTFPGNNFTPMCWKARVAFSVAGHKQKSCPLRSCAFAQTEIYTLSMLMNVISFDPHSDRTWIGVQYPFYIWEIWFSEIQCSAKGPQSWLMEMNPDLLMFKAVLFHVISLI